MSYGCISTHFYLLFELAILRSKAYLFFLHY